MARRGKRQAGLSERGGGGKMAVQHIDKGVGGEGKMDNAVLKNSIEIEDPICKETLNYQIRTEGFERLLLAMQHITQRIKKGEKCVATIEYDPNALFTKITTVIERSDTESNMGKVL